MGGEAKDLFCAGAVGSWLLSSGNPYEAKSVSWTGGAGADGDTAAWSGIGIGARAEPWRIRVGAVEPERRALRAELLPVPEPPPPPPDWDPDLDDFPPFPP